MCFCNSGLHGCYVDRGDIGGTKTGVGEMNGTVNMEEMTQLNHDEVGEPPMPFYY